MGAMEGRGREEKRRAEWEWGARCEESCRGVGLKQVNLVYMHAELQQDVIWDSA